MSWSTSSLSPQSSNSTTFMEPLLDRAPFPSAGEFRRRAELGRVKEFFGTKTQTEVLLFCMGILNFPNAPRLAKSTIVICLDTEHWNASSSTITEVGFCTFEARSMRGKDPGLFGANILRDTYFYHIRVAENAHFENRTSHCRGDPEKNRFGTTKFLTKGMTKRCLEDAFQWPVDPNDLGKGICPVVLLGHALSGDIAKLTSELAFEADAYGQVVKEVDTQIIARELDYWVTPRDQVGLKHLVPRLGFEYRDAHTACNDAAMSLIAAILLVLPSRYFPTKGSGLQQMIDDVEKRSKGNPFNYGYKEFCFRCQTPGHMETYPDGHKCRVSVFCTLCDEVSHEDPRRQASKYCHLACACVWHGLANGNAVVQQMKRETRQKEGGMGALRDVTSSRANRIPGTDRDGSVRNREVCKTDPGQGAARHLARGGAHGFLSRGPYISGTSTFHEQGRVYPTGLQARRPSDSMRGRGGHSGGIRRGS